MLYEVKYVDFPEEIRWIRYVKKNKIIILINKNIPKWFFFTKKNSQLPILAYTIVGVNELNFCVRDGQLKLLSQLITPYSMVLFSELKGVT